MAREARGWTLLLVRRDGLESHRLRVRWAWWAALGAAALLLLGAGAFLGRALERRSEARETRELRERVSRLTAREARVRQLAARLEAVEAEYARLQSALVGERAEGGASVPLPMPPTAARAAVHRGPDPALPAWPLAEPGFVTRAFGSRTEGTRGGHPGVDIAVPLGSYVRAARPGVVEASGRDSVYGLYVRIAHGDGVESLYGHNSWLFVAVGDTVEGLEVIALSGNTGRSTAPHLHFEVRRDGALIDPLAYVREARAETRGTTGRNGVEPR